jgi:hypothetical protein
MTDRERIIEHMLIAAGLMPTLVHIGRDDDVVSAKFFVGRAHRTFSGEPGQSDADAVAQIVREARALGL